MFRFFRIKPPGPQVKTVVHHVWLGEAPYWDPQTAILYFVGIFDKTIHKFNPRNRTHTYSKIDGVPTFIIPVEGKPDHYVVGLNRKLVLVKWTGREEPAAAIVKEIAEVDADKPKNRLNDGSVDPRGRLFAGTMEHEYKHGNFHLTSGALYNFGANGAPTKLIEGIDTCNGLCWDVNEKAFYFIDSLADAIMRYDYDIETGNIENPKVIFQYAKHDLHGAADGMTIDEDGNLWVANFRGHQVLKIDPKKGTITRRVQIPAFQVTSLTFGGQDLDELFITTMTLKPDPPGDAPPCGAVFKITGLGVKGVPNVALKLDGIDLSN